MKFAEFTENINQVYSGKFAHSACVVRPYRCLGRYVYIDCMLAENLNEVSYGIAGNDMFKISFCIDLPDNFNFEIDELPENLTMEAKANSYVIKPENEYLYCNLKKIPYRKSKGTAENLKGILSEQDLAEWIEMENKGKRLGTIVNTTSGLYARDATRGMRKLHTRKQKMLRKYGIIAR